MIFAREISDPLTSLVKKIDEATAKNKDAKMGSFIVFCSNDENMEKQVKALAEKENLKNIVLTVLDNPSGPPKYEVAKDADVTVVLYNKQTVEANHAFKKGGFQEEHVDVILKDLEKILPKK